MTTPRWLARPENLATKARAIWDFYAPGVAREGYLSAKTAEQFKFFCRLLVLARDAADALEADGVLIGNEAGAKKSHPAAEILFKAQERAEPLLRLFGLHGDAR
jgi:P27 family predicted phage terminase small subunit